MIANLQGNPRTTVISCYSPTNVSDENETANLYTELSALIRIIKRHNILIIGGDFNAHLGQEDGLKYVFHNTNRNGIMLKDYLQENKLLFLNMHFQKEQVKNGHINRQQIILHRLTILLSIEKGKIVFRIVEPIIHLST